MMFGSVRSLSRPTLSCLSVLDASKRKNIRGCLRTQVRLSQNQREESIGRWYGSIPSYDISTVRLEVLQTRTTLGVERSGGGCPAILFPVSNLGAEAFGPIMFL